MNSYFDSDADFDQWLRDEEASASDSETPSESVWERIRAARQQRRRRRFFFWLFLGGLAGGLLWFLFTMPPAVLHPAPTQVPVAARQSGQPPAQAPVPAPTPAAATEAIYHPRHPSTRTGNKPGRLAAGDPDPVALPEIPPPAMSPIPTETAPPHSGLPFAQSYDTPERLPVPLPLLPWTPDERNAVLRTSRAPEPPASPGCSILELGWVVQPMRTTIRNNAGNRSLSGRTWQTGLHAGIRIGRGLSVETGLQWSDLRLVTTRTGMFTYSIHSERFNPERMLFENSSAEQVEASLGAVDLRYDIGWDGNRPLFDQERFRIRIEIEERLRYLRLPAGLRYGITRGRWQWGFRGGLGLNIRGNYTAAVQSSRTDRLGIRRLRANAAGRSAAPESVFLDFHAGADVRYRLQHGFALEFGPSIRYGPGPGSFQNLSMGSQLTLLYCIPFCRNPVKSSP